MAQYRGILSLQWSRKTQLDGFSTPHPFSQIDSIMANHARELSLKNELYASVFDNGHLPLPPSKKLVVGKYILSID